MVGAQLHGGLVLGAFTPEGSALGLSFGFLGKIGGRLCLYSQLTGVVPGQRGRGLGGRLKTAQREFARLEGLNSLAWAFDPLQAGNAWFNLVRLGATSGRYVEEMYGQRTDALNAQGPTDRLIVEWSTAAPAPSPSPSPEDPNSLPRLIEGGERPRINRTVVEAEPSLLLEIPANIGSMRRDHPDQALAWSQVVRKSFRIAFEAGYEAVGFCREPISAYLLRRK